MGLLNKTYLIRWVPRRMGYDHFHSS